MAETTTDEEWARYERRERREARKAARALIGEVETLVQQLNTKLREAASRGMDTTVSVQAGAYFGDEETFPILAVTLKMPEHL